MEPVASNRGEIYSHVCLRGNWTVTEFFKPFGPNRKAEDKWRRCQAWTEKSMLPHTGRDRLASSPAVVKFECELCDRSFSEKWSLNNHMKLHTGAKPYKCTWPACHYSFLTMSAMKDHYRTHTGELRRLPRPTAT
ncbi:hypothetical protein JZ751_015637 [Albula glossodonta]|uniref:C2H2-type domain-containing protein n=1 Tax=Albula glossodonta TaxID=121402 RepID=A0A8T2NZD6_9TELE|nr:hypothetical protein JZ751_015637 [Albula glossodonta]